MQVKSRWQKKEKLKEVIQTHNWNVTGLAVAHSLHHSESCMQSQLYQLPNHLDYPKFCKIRFQIVAACEKGLLFSQLSNSLCNIPVVMKNTDKLINTKYNKIFQKYFCEV